MNKKTKIGLDILFILSLTPMYLVQFGANSIGVLGHNGLMILFEPLCILSIIIFFVSLWHDFEHQKINYILGITSLLGVILSEIKCFLFSYYRGPIAELELSYCISMAYPSFYLGLVISVVMLFVYLIVVYKKTKI
ncbi:MAG: hypothetical protein RR945_04820 [Erysipelotrichaceae bacterium]